MNVTHIEAYKAKLSANEEKRRLAFEFMQAECDVTYDVRRILSYRPFPIQRLLSPGTAKFKEANLNEAALQSFKADVFLEDILKVFVLAPLDRFLDGKEAVLKQNMQRVETEPFVSCAGTVEEYLARYPGYKADPDDLAGLWGANAREICLKEFKATVRDMLEKKQSAVDENWSAAFKSVPDWRAWGAIQGAVSIPSQEAKNYALFALRCMTSDASCAITALETWSVAGHAMMQRDAWRMDFENQRLFVSNRQYVKLRLPSGKEVLPHKPSFVNG